MKEIRFMLTVTLTDDDDSCGSVEVMCRCILADALSRMEEHPLVDFADFAKAHAKCDDCVKM